MPVSRVALVSCVLAVGTVVPSTPLAARALRRQTPASVAPAASPAGGLDPRIVKLVASISKDRMQQLLQKLSSFKTRNTCSDPSAPDGIGAARQWIFDTLKQTSPKLQVSFDTHELQTVRGCSGPVELRNVVAILPGRSPRRIYVSGHYDSINSRAGTPGGGAAARGAPSTRPGASAEAPGEASAAPRQFPVRDPNVVAPGANDDGSGTVLSMELARAFAGSGIDFDATLVFMTVAGEEEGLLGAAAHATMAKEQNIPIQAWFNNDIVGGSHGGDGIIDTATVRIYSEGPDDSPSRSLAKFTERIDAEYVPAHRIRLMARRDRFNRGGDFSALNAEGFTAIGFRESRENYSKQHGPGDTIDGVDFEYLLQNAKSNAAAMAVLALAPPPPGVVNPRGQASIDRRPSGYDADLHWQASPGAAGYEVFWRNAWERDWQHEVWVGNVTDDVLPTMNIDDWVFG
ncbi:MAG TPA: M28 family peptidase, partial [Vicinamibacterales bacterium]